MATNSTSFRRRAAGAAVLLLVLVPPLVRWSATWQGFPPTLDAASVDGALGLGAVLAVVALLVWRTRRPGDRRPTEGAPGRPPDRQVEGSGEVYAPYAYNNQRRARREGERIRKRAEEIAEADREARK